MKNKNHPNTSGPSRSGDCPAECETRDLLSLVASRTFAAVVAGMVFYTLVEYLIDRPADWPVFLTHHLLHVAVIGVAVWMVSAALINRLVIKPVDHVFLHLRRVASGRLEYLDFEVGSSQLGGVVNSLNELVARLRRSPEDDSVSRALDHVRELRTALRGRMSDSDDAVPIMRLVTKLEGDLLEVMQEHSIASPFNPNLNQPEPRTS
jgi:methyl-accepting chemotaxis protein